MSWLVWLALAVIVAAIAAVTGAQPKGTRPVSGSHLMGVARFMLFLIVLVFAYLAFRARSGG
jgi:small-conductance mechanosensitive channel